MVKMYDILKLLHVNNVNNDYQQDSRVLYTFVPNRPFGNLLEIRNLLEFQTIEAWFTDQNTQPLEIEGRKNLTLVIKQNIHYENEIFN